MIEQLEAENEELQRTRSETEQLHHKFADLYEQAPVGYLVLSSKYLIEQANETAREFLGSQQLSLNTSALGSFIHPDCQDQYYRALRGCRERREPETAEICVEREDGSFAWLLARISCDADASERTVRYRVTLSEITDRVRAQQNAEERRLEVEELLEEKELLLREIHHRVKNDFHLISSFLALQGGASENPEVKAAMEEARNRVTVMMRIYHALHQQAQYARVNLGSLVEEIAAGFEGGVAGSAVRVRTMLEEMVATTATALSLGLVFNELLTNAGKYAFDSVSEPELHVGLRRLNEDELELEVSDNGVGFPEEVVNGSQRGFGLTIAESLAQQHHGSLSLENGNGRPEGSQYPGAVARVRMQLG